MKVLLVTLCALVPTLAYCQDVRYLACGTVAFFAEGCVPGQDLPAPQEDAPPIVPPKPPSPLFPKETLAADAPPLFVALLETPTLENAQTFLAWQRERLARMTLVQHLLKQAAQPTP